MDYDELIIEHFAVNCCELIATRYHMLRHNFWCAQKHKKISSSVIDGAGL